MYMRCHQARHFSFYIVLPVFTFTRNNGQCILQTIPVPDAHKIAVENLVVLAVERLCFMHEYDSNGSLHPRHDMGMEPIHTGRRLLRPPLVAWDCHRCLQRFDVIGRAL